MSRYSSFENSIGDRRCSLSSNGSDTEFKESGLTPIPSGCFGDSMHSYERDDGLDTSLSRDEMIQKLPLADEDGVDVSSSDDDNTLMDAQHKQMSKMSEEIPRLLKKYGKGVLCFKDFNDQKLPTLIPEIQDIIEKFQNCVEEGRAFIAIFSTYKENRSKIIKKLNKLAKSLNKKRYRSNVSRLAGSSIGAIGGALAIAGTTLMPLTAGLSSTLIVGGSALSATGVTVNIVTAVKENSKTKKLIEGAKELIKKDETQFKDLKKWFEHSSQFTESVKKVMDFDIWMHLQKDILIIKDTAFKNVNKSISLKNMIKFAVCFCIKRRLTTDESMRVVQAVVAIFSNPDIRKLTMNLHSSNPFIYDVIAMTGKLALELTRISKAGVGVANTLVSVVKDCAKISKPVEKVFNKGIFIGLGLTFDVLSIVLTSIDIYKGSKHYHLPMIESLANTLEEELCILTELNEKLQKLM